MSNVSISGAISGIDTASLVNQLMNVEAQSQTSIKTKQTAAQKAADSYTSLIKSLKTLATQSAELAKTSTWQGSSATSSAASVTATTTGNAVGTITFDVTEIAKAHTLISDPTATPAVSTSSVIASGGTLTIYNGTAGTGTPRGTVSVGGGTLAEVVAGINASSLGLRAAAVQTAPGEFRLQVTSTTSGAAAAFSLDGLDGPVDPTDMNILTAGTDAMLTIGTVPGTGYTVTSASNTFTDLLPGVSLTVSKKGETNVTVDAKLDGTAVATQVSAMVDATNAVLTTLAASTAYNFGTKSGAALYGDSSIRSLQQQILTTVGGAGAAGVQLTRDGKLTFDKAAFLKAFVADPETTAQSYGATSSFTPNTGVLGKAAMALYTANTRAGTYDVEVSVRSAKEKWTATPGVPIADGQVFTVSQGSKTATYTVGEGGAPTGTFATMVAAMNIKAAAAGITTTASTDGTSLFMTANGAGVASAFTMSFSVGPAAAQTTAGRDIVGTIDGEEATGIGDILTLNSATSDANGLSLTIDITPALYTGLIGDVEFKPGLAQNLSRLLGDATESTTGSLAQSQQRRVDDVKDFQAQIDAWDIRLASRRTSLTRQFSAMETALASLKSSSSAITNLLAATENANA